MFALSLFREKEKSFPLAFDCKVTNKAYKGK